MAYASIAGRARTSDRNPQAHAICDRCGFRYNWVDLTWQFDYRGPALANLRILVCKPCLDKPQEQLRAIVLPADPTPIINARPEYYQDDETNFRSVAAPTVYDPKTGIPIPSTNLRVDQNCNNRITLPYGQPIGLDANAIPPLALTNGVPTRYGVPIPALSVFAVGCTVSVTCAAPHNLQPNDQVAVNGLTAGNGFFSVLVPTATLFTYNTTQPVSPQLTSNTRIVTAQVGLPKGSVTFPLTQAGTGIASTTPAMLPGPPLDVSAS